MSGVPREETEDSSSGSPHRFMFIFPVPFDNSVPEKALPWRVLEIEPAEPVLDVSSVFLQSQDMAKGEVGSSVATLVEGAVYMAESMETSLLHRYDSVNLYIM